MFNELVNINRGVVYRQPVSVKSSTNDTSSLYSNGNLRKFQKRNKGKCNMRRSIEVENTNAKENSFMLISEY